MCIFPYYLEVKLPENLSINSKIRKSRKDMSKHNRMSLMSTFYTFVNIIFLLLLALVSNEQIDMRTTLTVTNDTTHTKF